MGKIFDLIESQAEVYMSKVNLIILHVVHIVASLFWAGEQLLFTGDAPFTNANEGLFSSIVYKKL